MTFPEDLRYTKDHEWVRVGADHVIEVGITDFAQSELGDIVYVELEPVGSSFDQDDVFGTVEAVKTVSDLFLPVGGEITALNEDLEDNPELVNQDPYGAGWMVKVRMDDPDELDGLMTAEDYAGMVGA